MLNGLDLFSGIGGLSVALSEWVRPIAYCENDRYAQAVLLSRMGDGCLPIAPIWDDVQTLRMELLPILPDIIYGGFPCQDISLAGHGEGLGGKQSRLFYEVTRLVSEIRPRFIFLENVPAISTRGLEQVLLEITSLGYDCRWDIVSAKEVGARHERKRWFLLAHANSKQERLQSGWGIGKDGEEKIFSGNAMENGENPYSYSSRMAFSGSQVRSKEKQPLGFDILEGNTWDTHAAYLLRMADGIPHRSHRIRALGNSVVPAQAREAFKRLMGL